MLKEQSEKKESSIVERSMEQRKGLLVGYVKEALLTRPRDGLLLREIQAFVGSRYPKYAKERPGWKGHIRNVLSSNAAFRRRGRAKGSTMRGSYWVLADRGGSNGASTEQVS